MAREQNLAWTEYYTDQFIELYKMNEHVENIKI